jgi:hypothetical protein
MKVWIAEMALGDDPNDPGTEVIGVFSSEEAALVAGRKFAPRTAQAVEYEIDELPDWDGLL